MLITLLKLKEILQAVKTNLQKTNPDYDFVIKRLYSYYDMKLVSFGIDRGYKSDNTMSSIYTAIHTAATNIILNRNCANSKYRSKHASDIPIYIHRWIQHMLH